MHACKQCASLHISYCTFVAALNLQVDVAFDEVDQLDVSANACVIGTSSEPQQPQLQQAQTVARLATTFVVMADAENVSELHHREPCAV